MNVKEGEDEGDVRGASRGREGGRTQEMQRVRGQMHSGVASWCKEVVRWRRRRCAQGSAGTQHACRRRKGATSGGALRDERDGNGNGMRAGAKTRWGKAAGDDERTVGVSHVSKCLLLFKMI